jgi:hypothetical protein
MHRGAACEGPNNAEAYEAIGRCLRQSLSILLLATLGKLSHPGGQGPRTRQRSLYQGLLGFLLRAAAIVIATGRGVPPPM